MVIHYRKKMHLGCYWSESKGTLRSLVRGLDEEMWVCTDVNWLYFHYNLVHLRFPSVLH